MGEVLCCNTALRVDALRAHCATKADHRVLLQYLNDCVPHYTPQHMAHVEAQLGSGVPYTTPIATALRHVLETV